MYTYRIVKAGSTVTVEVWAEGIHVGYLTGTWSRVAMAERAVLADGGTRDRITYA